MKCGQILTHQSPLQLPQSLHRLRIVTWDLPHIIVLQSQHGFQHETHLRTCAHTDCLCPHLSRNI